MVPAKKSRLIGPNCPRIITPGECKIGIDARLYSQAWQRRRAFRAAALLPYEAVWQLTSRGYGQSTCIGIGGDPINGMSHLDAVKLFNDDPKTEHRFDRRNRWSRGRRSRRLDQGEMPANRWRHSSPGDRAARTPDGPRGCDRFRRKGTAAGKIEALKAAGIAVADTPATMADTLIARMKERK
jgi:succinyl-CoA synthetase alpha subunit